MTIAVMEIDDIDEDQIDLAKQEHLKSKGVNVGGTVVETSVFDVQSIINDSQQEKKAADQDDHGRGGTASDVITQDNHDGISESD